MQVESSATPLLTIDEVEKSLIGHVFQLTYGAMIHKLVQQWNLIHISGCPKKTLKNAVFSAAFFAARAWERSALSLKTAPYFFNGKVYKTTLSCEYTSLRADSQLIMHASSQTLSWIQLISVW